MGARQGSETAMRFLMLIKHSEDYRKMTVPTQLIEAMGPFVEGYMKSGVLLDTAGLLPMSASSAVRLSGGKVTVVDGPFAEGKEVVGGYALMEVPSHAEAVDLAVKFMELHREHFPEFEGVCEVRPLEQH